MKNFILGLLMVLPMFVLSQIQSYEYWFDNNYANKVSENVTTIPILNLNANLIATGLQDGVHSINIRFKDQNNDWSSVLSQFFYKVPDVYLINNPNMVQYEYWFDNNSANKVTENVTANPILNLNANLITTGLQDGVHSINIRFKDQNNDWSSVLSQFFYKVPEVYLINNPKMVQYEYWYDNNYVNKVSQNVAATQLLNLNENLDVSGLQDGVHAISIRFKDENNDWSSVLSQFFYKNPDNSITFREITGYEYWFNNDYNNVVSTNITQVSTFNIDTFVLPENYGLDIGTHQLNVRFKDNTGLWSSVMSNQFEINTLEIPENNLLATKVFPNPTTGLLKVYLPDFFKEIKIQLIDFNGRTVLNSTKNNIQEIDINLNYPAGFYLLIIEQDQKRSVHKIIKK